MTISSTQVSTASHGLSMVEPEMVPSNHDVPDTHPVRVRWNS
jgi:hypothetical protein